MNPEFSAERIETLYQQRVLELVSQGMNTRQAKRHIAKEQRQAIKRAKKRTK